uniref:chemotaxis protein CheY n=2 Tax=Microbacteriaceae TaxID=85023 RepID=UPI001F563CE8
WPDAVLSNPCARCGGPHGAVQVSGAPWRAAVSYAGGAAVAAIHPDRATRFAVDAEVLADPVRDQAGGAPGGLLRWVRVEAVLKADGRGLRGDPDAVVIEETAAGWRARMPPEPTTYAGREVDGPPGILVAVAVAAPL